MSHKTRVGTDVNFWFILVAFHDMGVSSCPVAYYNDRFDKQGLQRTCSNSMDLKGICKREAFIQSMNTCHYHIYPPPQKKILALLFCLSRCFTNRNLNEL